MRVGIKLLAASASFMALGYFHGLLGAYAHDTVPSSEHVSSFAFGWQLFFVFLSLAFLMMASLVFASQSK